MAKLLKLRRGTTTQHGSFTGAEGEVTIDTTKDTAVVHDGSQAGGRPLAREDLNNVSGTTVLGRISTNTLNGSKLVDGTVSSAKITNNTIVNADVNSSAAIAGTKISPNFGSQNVSTTGTVSATSFSGSGANLTGIQPFASGTKMLFQQTSAPTGWTKVTTHNNKALRVVSGTASSGGSNAFSNTLASRSINANSGNATQGGNVSVSVGNATAGGNVSIGNTAAGGNVSIGNTSTGGNVNSHTLSVNQIPAHSHTNNYIINSSRNRQNTSGLRGMNQSSGRMAGNGSWNTSNTGGNGGHSHGFSGSSHNHNASFSGSNHNHNASFSGSAHSHNANASFSGSAHNHSISVGNLDMAVQYVDVIIASKN